MFIHTFFGIEIYSCHSSSNLHYTVRRWAGDWWGCRGTLATMTRPILLVSVHNFRKIGCQQLTSRECSGEQYHDFWQREHCIDVDLPQTLHRPVMIGMGCMGVSLMLQRWGGKIYQVCNCLNTFQHAAGPWKGRFVDGATKVRRSCLWPGTGWLGSEDQMRWPPIYGRTAVCALSMVLLIVMRFNSYTPNCTILKLALLPIIGPSWSKIDHYHWFQKLHTTKTCKW